MPQPSPFRFVGTSLFLGLSLLPLNPMQAQDTRSNSVAHSKTSVTAEIPEVTRAMQSFVDQGEIVGGVTMVVTRNDVLHQSAVGLRSIEAKLPMETDTIVWIASMTKPMTGICILMLQDEGKLSLDDPISKHLPEMKDLKTVDGKTVNVTIRHVLTHTSGMSEPKPEETYTFKSLKEASLAYAKLPVTFEPGSKWQYSQTGINTAARIVEVASGKTFDAFLQERLTGPLGMKDTTFYLTSQQMERLATSYRRTDDGKSVPERIFLLAGHSPTDRDRFPAANGGLFSTAGDYARLCQMLLNGGQWEGKRFLSDAALKTFSTVATGDLSTGFTPGNGWGIGCCVVRQPQGASQKLSAGSFGHGGAYGTQAWIDPVRGRAFLLMVQRSNFPNADDSDVRKSFQEIASDHLK